jgi:hypothetical protein
LGQEIYNRPEQVLRDVDAVRRLRWPDADIPGAELPETPGKRLVAHREIGNNGVEGTQVGAETPGYAGVGTEETIQVPLLQIGVVLGVTGVLGQSHAVRVAHHLQRGVREGLAQGAYGWQGENDIPHRTAADNEEALHGVLLSRQRAQNRSGKMPSLQVNYPTPIVSVVSRVIALVHNVEGYYYRQACTTLTIQGTGYATL